MGSFQPIGRGKICVVGHRAPLLKCLRRWFKFHSTVVSLVRFLMPLILILKRPRTCEFRAKPPSLPRY